jgi:hypothetical protein
MCRPGHEDSFGHEEKWPATKEQVNFVREYHSKVAERFKLAEET